MEMCLPSAAMILAKLGLGNEVNISNTTQNNSAFKFNEIESYCLSYPSKAKTENDFYYVWGKCKSESYSSLKETGIKSIEEIF
jgi:hypothetical protein